MPLKGTTAAGCTPNARVIVGDTEVPWVNGDDGTGGVEVQMRKSGPADITRFSDVHIPYEWGGEDVFQEISTPSYLPNPNGPRTIGNAPVRIDVYDNAFGEYKTVHHGPVASVGTSSLDGCFRLHVTDWANYFESLSADVEFPSSRTTKAQDVLSYVANRLEEHTGIPDFSLSVANVEVLPSKREVLVAESDEAGIEYLTDPLNPTVIARELFETRGYFTPEYHDDPIKSGKSFSEYKHSLDDVMNWLTERVDNVRWYIDYNEEIESPSIIFDVDPSAPSFDSIGLNETVGFDPTARLIENNALFQISPMHTLGVRGKEYDKEIERTYQWKGEHSYVISSDVRSEVIVEHEELAEIAGTNNAPQFKNVDTETLEETEAKAKKMLKDKIDGASGGEMVALPFAYARPYATIDAFPTCNGRREDDVEKITYEIEEVIHDITSPTPNNDGATTLLRCGISCDIERDLNVRRSLDIQI